MPHERPRYASENIARILTYSPIVGILGQRQVGKTTLLEAACDEYVTFDRATDLNQAKADAEIFLQKRKIPFGIDEAQLCPPLFPALKEWVRTHKRQGQFILSGSVRFTSKADIRESLTGRIMTHEVLPFTIAEAAERPLPQTCEKLLQVKSEGGLDFLQVSGCTPQGFRNYLACGGLPGIAFFRDAHIRAGKFEAHIDTLLNRDFRQIYSTTLPFEALRELLRYMARNQGRPFESTEASRVSQISRVTLKKVMFALEALFLIKVVPAVDEKKSTVFLQDQGTASWLKESVFETADDIVRGLYANLRQEYHYRLGFTAKISHWRTRNGVEVPLVFSSKSGRLGIIPILNQEPTPKTLGAAKSFLQKFQDAKVVIAYSGTEIVYKTPSMFWIPYWMLC